MPSSTPYSLESNMRTMSALPSLQLIEWGQKTLPDIIAEFIDGEAEFIADDEFATLVSDLPLYNMQCDIRYWQRRIDSLQEAGTKDVPRRPVKRGVANPTERNATRQPVPRLYDHGAWQAALHSAQWEDMPPDQHCPFYCELQAQPVFLVLHLLSGRRRRTDFHAHLNAWAETHSCHIHVL